MNVHPACLVRENAAEIWGRNGLGQNGKAQITADTMRRSVERSLYNLTTGIMWFVTALIGVAAVILVSQFINENRILQYFGRISLIVLCIHGPVYRVVVKIISIPLHMGTDAVREKFLLAMLVMIVTMVICSLAYEIIVRVAPWMIGKKKVKAL